MKPRIDSITTTLPDQKANLVLFSGEELELRLLNGIAKKVPTTMATFAAPHG